MRFHHAERFTLAEVVGFTGDVMVMRWDINIMLMVRLLVGFAQVCWVKTLADITANLPRVIPARHAAMFVFTGGFCGQRLPWLFAGLASDADLHGRQVGLLEHDGIAAAGLADVCAAGFTDTNGFIFPGIDPFRPRVALIRVNVLRVKFYGANRIIQLPCLAYG